MGGCSGGKDTAQVPPDAWAATVCTEIASWQDQVRTMAIGLGSEIERQAENLPGARGLVVAFLDDLVRSADVMIARVEDAGAPRVSGGDDIARRARSRLSELREALADSKERAEDIPVDSPTAFERGAEAFGTTSSHAVENVTRVADELEESAVLGKAFREAPACRRFSS